MHRKERYELHSFSTGANQREDQPQLAALPWQEDHRELAHVITLDKPGPLAYHIGYDSENGQIVMSDEANAVAELHLVQRKLGTALGLLALGPGILVNGLPALRFTVLSPRDGLVLARGLHTYVTERFRPYVGRPPQDLIGKRCPFCRIPISADTRIVTHRCGVAYHHETAESHPEVPEADRLNCFQKVRACLSCTRPVSLEEELVWDPACL